MRIDKFNRKYSGEQILAEIRARGDQQKARTLAEQARQAEARLDAQANDKPLKTLSDVLALSASELRRLMQRGESKKQIEKILAKENRAKAKAQAQRDAEQEEQNEQLQEQMQQMLGGNS